MESLIVSNNFVYAYINIDIGNQFYGKRSIVKLDYADGKLILCKNLQLINIPDISPIALNQLSDMMFNPHNKSQIFMAFRIRYSVTAVKIYTGNVMIYDNGT